jgi:hypothetical protein
MKVCFILRPKQKRIRKERGKKEEQNEEDR